MLVSNTYP